MSDRQLLNVVYKECLQACEQLQEEVTKKREQLQSDTFQTSFSLQKVSSDFRVRRTLTGHYGKIYAIHWSLNNETGICSASQDGKLMIWNGHTENKLLAIPLKSAWVMTCAYSPTSTYVSSGGLDNHVSIFRLNAYDQGYGDRKMEPYYELEQHEGYISCIRFWDDQHVISSSGDSTLLLWDIEKGQPISHFLDHAGTRWIYYTLYLFIGSRKMMNFVYSVDSVDSIHFIYFLTMIMLHGVSLCLTLCF